MRSSKHPRSASRSPLANAAVMTATRVIAWTVSALENRAGTSSRAAGVLTSKSGTSVTNVAYAETRNRSDLASFPIKVEAVNPPNIDGVALSGCPSVSVTRSSNR